MLKHLILTITLLFFFSGFSQGQRIEADTLIQAQDSTSQHISGFHRMYQNIYRYFMESNDIKEEKRFDFSIIGGPHFASDTKLGLGVVASGLYRIDRTDLTLSPSNISLYGDITTTGFYLLGIRGNTIFPKDRYRLGLNLYFFSFPSKYWGIGYENASRANDYTNYKRKETLVRIDFSRRLIRNTYLGITGLYCHVNGKDFEDIHFLKDENSNTSSSGLGVFLTYDSRDFIPNPYSGTYAKLEQLFFPDFFGNKFAFRRTEISARQYTKLWKGAILASDLQGVFNYGKPPWSMVALMGGSYQMRGYYEGQYRDNNLIQTQIEIRQHIYNRHGVAIWGGAGNIFHNFDCFRWQHTLPTYGLGYRWEFKKRVNVRLDYGFGKGQSAFYFNIEEAF